MPAAWVAVIGAIAGAAAQADAARKASKTMAGAAGDANAAQLAMYNQSRTDQAPYRTVGMSALERLAGGAGLNTPTMTGVTRDTQAPLVDTSGGAPTYNPTLYANNEAYRRAWDEVAAEHQRGFGSGYVWDSDPAWIEAQVRARLPEAAPQEQAPAGAMGGVPEENPLTRRFAAEDLRADPLLAQLGGLDRRFSEQDRQNDFANRLGLTRRFTAEDLQADPVYQASYQAGLDMGTKKITEQLRASGLSNSGGAIKALSRYATDYTSQKAGDAFTRFQGEQANAYNRNADAFNRFQAEQGNAFARGNEAFNRFQVGQGNERNFLSSLAGIGQQATNQVGAAGTNFANNSSNIAMTAGQNAAAGQIAQGNIWGGTVQGIGNWYQNQSTLDKLLAARGGQQGYGQQSSAPAYNWESQWGTG